MPKYKHHRGYAPPSRVPLQEVEETRNKLLTAFKAIRKERIIARANFSCCTSCGSDELNQLLNENSVAATFGAYAIADEVKRKGGVSYDGFVFWNKQDDEGFQSTGKLYLAYGVADHSPLSLYEVGKIITKILREHDIHVKWTGDVNRKLLILIPSEVESCPVSPS